MPKTVVPRNALRPAGNNTLAQQYVPFRHADPMMNMVPQLPTGPVVNSVSQPSTLQMLDDVLTGYSRGAGRARVEDFEMMKDLMTRPKGVYEDLVQAARALAANPDAAMNTLKTSAQQAVSSPTAFGEAVGSFGLPKLGKARGVMHEIDLKPTPERAKALREDLMGKAVRGEITWDEYHERSKPLLDIQMKNDLLKRQRENQGKPPGPVFEGIDAKKVPNGTRVSYARYPSHEPQSGVVIGTYLVHTKHGPYRGLVLRLENGKEVQALHSQLREVFMPRAINPADEF